MPLPPCPLAPPPRPRTPSALCHSCPLSSIYLSLWMPAGPSPACPAARTAPLSSAQPRGPLPVTPLLLCTLAPTQEKLWLKLPPSSHPAVLAPIQMLLPRGGGWGAAWGEAKGMCVSFLPEPAPPAGPCSHPSAGLSLTPALLSRSHCTTPDSGPAGPGMGVLRSVALSQGPGGEGGWCSAFFL